MGRSGEKAIYPAGDESRDSFFPIAPKGVDTREIERRFTCEIVKATEFFFGRVEGASAIFSSRDESHPAKYG